MKSSLFSLLLLVGCSAHKPMKVAYVESGPKCPTKLIGDCWQYSDGKVRCEHLKLTFTCTTPAKR